MNEYIERARKKWHVGTNTFCLMNDRDGSTGIDSYLVRIVPDNEWQGSFWLNGGQHFETENRASWAILNLIDNRIEE